MATREPAVIWREMFRLGLTKRSICKYLGIPAAKRSTLWYNPNAVMTFTHLRLLSGLVASHYTIRQLAELLTKDYIPAKSVITEDFIKALGILMTPEGLEQWDSFIKRKNTRNNKSVRKDKAAKFDRNRNAYKRLCADNVEHTDIVEFVVERERLDAISSVQSPIPPVDNSPSVKI